jgi:hypothetical protein
VRPVALVEDVLCVDKNEGVNRGLTSSRGLRVMKSRKEEGEWGDRKEIWERERRMCGKAVDKREGDRRGRDINTCLLS